MAHHCDACVVTCEDFRLHRRAGGSNLIGEFVAGLGVDCDVITRGGAAQDLVRPQPGFENSLLRDIRVSVELHSAGTVYLVHHEDCGAYGAIVFETRDAEIEQNYSDLRAARDLLQREFPGVNVELRFAELEPGSADRFVIRSIE